MATADGDQQSDRNSELCDLKQKVINLEEELTSCRNQLLVLQKELNHTEVLYKDTKSCNEELYKQIKDLSEKPHERNEESNRVDVEVQTDLCFTHEHTDYQEEDVDFYHQLENDENERRRVPGDVTDSVPVQSQTQPQTDSYQYSEIVETDNYQYTEYLDKSTLPDGTDHKNVDEDTRDSMNTSLAESLRATAEAAMSQTGFTYDESSGLYYDYSTGFYYDSTNQLYYDPNTGIYYYYDAGSGLYQFHSRVDLHSYHTAHSERKVKKKRKVIEKLESKEGKDIESEISKASSDCRFWDQEESELSSSEKRRKTKVVDIDNSSSNGLNQKLDLSVQGEGDLKMKLEEEDEAGFASEPEEGEITDSEQSSFVDEETEESDEGEDNENMKEGQLWPPCIRVMVVRSPVLEPGTLFIITAVKTATIGREKDMGHAIRIAELGVSKFHAEVYFDQDLQEYMLLDKGSQNGTVVNGNRILAVKDTCDPYKLEHGDEIKFGETVLSFHIHPGTDTCNGCEPGQVIAHLRLNKKEEPAVDPVLSKQDKDKLRRHELKQIQVKYGLQNSAYEIGEVLKNKTYKDRAAKRRQEIGSDGVFKRDDAPASVHVEICDDNKGRKMLEKMGWKKGEGLGKGSCGIKEPIQVHLHQSQSGLGANVPLSIEDVQMSRSNKHKNWAKARARFSETFQQTASQKEADAKTVYVKAECESREPEDSTI